MTYEDARLRGKTIAAVTRSRYMPPWKADAGDYSFVGERRLTESQIDTLEQWVNGGLLEGDPKKMPKAPVFKDEWPLGKPDLVVSMPEAFEVPASGPDVFRNFVLALNLKKDQWIRAVDFRASARKVVHHSLFFSDPSGQGRELDAADPLPGFAGLMEAEESLQENCLRWKWSHAFGVANLSRRTRLLVAPAVAEHWVDGFPAAGRRTFPDDIALFAPKGSDLIVSTHFSPVGQSGERETSTVALYFAKSAPSRPFMVLQMPPMVSAFKGINIPAGEANYVVSDSFVLPIDVKAFSTNAHAHYLAREVKLTATFPDRKVKTLLSISDWDINWQGSYVFKDYVTLPAGTRLDATIRYDNSASNRRNPSRPPVRVTFGEQSTNEMGAIGLGVIATTQGSLPRLRDAYEQHLRQEILASPLMRGRGAR